MMFLLYFLRLSFSRIQRLHSHPLRKPRPNNYNTDPTLYAREHWALSRTATASFYDD
jgi:hypothetical protein